MVTKSKDPGGKKSEKVKLGKLQLTKETVKDLTGAEKKAVKGGAVNRTTVPCHSIVDSCFATDCCLMHP